MAGNQSQDRREHKRPAPERRARPTRAQPARRARVGLLWIAAVLLSLLSPPSRLAHANQPPGEPTEPLAPPPLAVPASWFDTPQAASLDRLPLSSDVTATGQLALSVPLDTPAVRGLAPSLAFSYTSTQEPGWLGVGWSLSGLSAITRCRKTLATSGITAGITFGPKDDLCLDGERLVLVKDAYAPGCNEYRTERDPFSRIVGCGDSPSGPTSFEVRSKRGHIALYRAMLAVQHDGTTVRVAWPIREMRDRADNVVRYRYDTAPSGGGFFYRPSEIEYTGKAPSSPDSPEEPGLRKVVFDYEPRPDPITSYVSGILSTIPERLSAVRVIAPNPATPEVVARYEVTYEQSPSTGRSLISQIRRCDGGAGADRACLWAKQFTWWQSARPEWEGESVWDSELLAPEVAFSLVLDADGDGKDDLLTQVGYRTIYDIEPEIYLFRGSDDLGDHGFLPPILLNDPYSWTSTFHFVDVAQSRPADIDGDGAMELLAYLRPPPDQAPYTPGYYWFRWNSADEAFEPFGELFEGGAGSAQLVDLDGDGRIDLLRAEPEPANPAHWLFHKNVNGDVSAAEATPYWAFEPGRAVGIDLDGNGRGELFVVDPVEGQDPTHLVPLGLDDSGALKALDASWVVESQSAEAIPPVFADLHGDGLKDALWLSQEPKKVRDNTGAGFLPAQELDLPGALLDVQVRDGGLRVADFDGDGREDLLSLEGLDDIGEPVMRLFLSRPTGFETRDLGASPGYKAPFAGWSTTKLGDFNGDGWLDLVTMPADIWDSPDGGAASGYLDLHVWLQAAPAPGYAVSDLLFEVRDEGAPLPQTSVFYTPRWDSDPESSLVPGAPSGAVPPACQYPQLCVRRGFPVVRMVATPSFEPAAVRWAFFDYEDPRADLRGRGFLGFGAKRVWDPQLHAETVTTFDHATHIDDRYPFAGLPQHTIHIVPLVELPTDGSDQVPVPATPVIGHVTSIHQHYTYSPLYGGATYFTPLTEWSRIESEPDVLVSSEDVEILGPASAPSRKTQGTLEWDDFGNPTYDFAHTSGGSARLTLRSYDHWTDDWRIGLLRQTLESAGDLAHLPEPREVTFDYDDRGLLQWSTVEPEDPLLFRRTAYIRNADGLVYKLRELATDVPARTTYFTFDELEHTYVSAVYNDFGHATRMVTHPAFGAPIATADPNGVLERRQYDSLGRLIRVEPGGSAPTDIVYEEDRRKDPDHPHGIAITETRAGAFQTTFVDPSGRAQETRSSSLDGKVVVRKTDYNAFGQPVRVHKPEFFAASPLYTETTYDALGRVRAVQRPNGDRAEITYSMEEILQWDFNHHMSRLTIDSDGRVQKSSRFDGHWIDTHYEYGDFGDLTDVWDAENHRTEMVYDKLGRRTVLSDPDKGITQYSYNGLGELHTVDDNDPATPLIELHRDLLGRVTARKDGDGTTETHYDGPGGLDKLWWTTSPSGVKTTFLYDEYGRPRKTTWSLTSQAGAGIGDGTYEIERTYDGDGRLKEVWYPEILCADCQRFGVRYTYTPTGYLHQVKDARATDFPLVYWQVDERNAEDQRVHSRWAPNALSVDGSAPVEQRSYDPVLGRLDTIVTTVGNDPVFQLTYGYDANGLVTSRTDPVTGRAETFGLDGLDRLTSWTLDHNDGSRQVSYSYDDLDNLIDIVEDGVKVLTHAYGAVVPGAPVPKPHTLDTISGSIAAKYHYDLRGRQIEGGGRGITWTDFDLPKEISHSGGTTTFEYDAKGHRVRKTQVDPDTGAPIAAAVTLGGLFEGRENVATGTAESVFYVLGEDGAVAQITIDKTTSTETTRYLQRDGLGTVALVLDSAGSVLERRYFEPFGQRTDAAGTPLSSTLTSVELGFTGHRHDTELGLIDMRGRVYDPLQKHFLSPDPLIGDPLSAHDLNRYSYAWNNPLSITDPNGLDETAPHLPHVPIPTLGEMVEGFKRTLAWLTGAPSTPAPPQATKPAVQTTDAQGASPATGPNAQPAPQTQPASTPQTTTPRTDPPVDANGFVPYNPKSQHIGGFFAGLAIGPVPLGSLIANILIERGILPPSTPEFRQSLAEGQMAGGLIGLLWGAGQTPSTAPIQAPRPVPAVAGTPGGAPPLTVTPNLTGVLVGAGGVVTIAVAAAQMATVMSDGPVGGGDIKERDERQVHHPISRKVHRALERHSNLKGKYKARDPRYELRAVSKEAHNGYQDWHRKIDDEIIEWIEGHEEATVETFEAYLRSVYSRPEVAARFTNGL